MTPETIIREARKDGVTLALSEAHNIKATGDGTAVGRWLAVIREHKMEIVDSLKVGASDISSASRRWLIHYCHRDPVEIVCCPDATYPEILHLYPDSIAAEPLVPTIRRPSTPLTASEEAAICAWLDRIDEADPEIIDEKISQCIRDADARRYFAEMATSQIDDRSVR
jgi:hypothetical protein